MNLSNCVCFFTAIILASTFPTSSSSSSSFSSYCISSTDVTISICVDSTTGQITSVVPNSNGNNNHQNQELLSNSFSWSTNISTLLLESTVTDTIVNQINSTTITVQQHWLFTPSASPYVPSNAGAIVTDTYTSTASSIRWNVNIIGTSLSPWSVPIQQRFNVSSDLAKNDLKLWSAWDRGSASNWVNGKYVDPLQPSDVLPASWWDGEYRYGNPRGSFGDYIALPIVSLLSADPYTNTLGDNAVSLILDPSNPPLDLWMYTVGTESAYFFEHHHFRIQSNVTINLNGDLVAHSADLRGGLAWLYQAYPEYLEPVNTEVFVTCAGTGSYSYNTGYNLTNPALYEMDYTVNWVLSGTYFPYMGYYSVDPSSADWWLNDPEGSQPVINVSLASMSENHRAYADYNFTDLSYFNVNEFGLNIVLPPSSSSLLPGDHRSSSVGKENSVLPFAITQPVLQRPEDLDTFIFNNIRFLLVIPENDTDTKNKRIHTSTPESAVTCQTNWQNASDCLITSLYDALVTSSWDEIGQRVVHGPYYSWQNAVVVDPGTPDYHSFMLEQLVRQIMYVDAFAGIVIDRSDWQDVYNFHMDDGISFVAEAVNNKTNPPLTGVSSSMKVTYATMIQDLRTAITNMPYILAKKEEYIQKYPSSSSSSTASSHLVRSVTPSGKGIMMMNGVGNSRLDNYRYYDGTFSEGYAVNGEGLLSIMSPGILWTYDPSEVGTSTNQSGRYFQTHIYMGIVPMAPFIGNDHSIDWDVTAVSLYSRYGSLFRSIANKVWALYPHIVSITNETASVYAKLNAFVTLSTINNAPEQTLTIPVMLAENCTGNVYVNLTNIQRIWTGDVRIFPQPDRNLHIHPYLRPRNEEISINTHYRSLLRGTNYIFEVLYPGVNSTFQPLLTTTDTSLILTVPVVENCAIVRVRNQ